MSLLNCLLIANTRVMTLIKANTFWTLTLAKHWSKHFKLIYSFNPPKASHHYLKNKNTAAQKNQKSLRSHSSKWQNLNPDSRTHTLVPLWVTTGCPVLAVVLRFPAFRDTAPTSPNALYILFCLENSHLTSKTHLQETILDISRRINHALSTTTIVFVHMLFH